MCGIAAIFAYSADSPGVDRDELIAMRDQMTARGPDGSGAWFSPDGRVALGHRRLAIIDLSPAGAQPMWNADRTRCVTLNGEIYNYQALRAQLQARGHAFHSNSDTEVLLHLYAEKGAAMVHDLRGMFAFAIWDAPNRCLFLARDPFGIKPLYYADDGRTIRAASSVKALLRSKHIDTAPEPAGHVGFFVWGHVPDPITIFKGIKALPAGHTLTINGGANPNSEMRTAQPYCSIPEILRSAQQQAFDSPLSALDGRELFRQALTDSVAHHLIADVPVGVFQSAGRDSSTLTALASEVHPSVRTVTLGFNEYRGTENDEVPLAETVARSCGTNHKTVWVSRADFESSAGALLEAMDRPSIDGVNTYFVSQAARVSGLKVALSGLGGDELFSGYPSFRDVPRMAHALRPLAVLPALGRGFRLLTGPMFKRFTSPKYAGLFEYGSTYGGAYLLRRGLFMPWELPEFLDPDLVREGWQRLDTLNLLRQTTDRLTTDRLKVSALELCWYMRHQLLRDADWAGMAHSLEIRVPLVDLELLRRIAPLLAGANAPTKHELACSPRSPLPAAVLSRPKTGFSVPVHEWLLQAASSAGPALPRPAALNRGLRGWARLVYAHFGGTTGAMPHSRVFPSADVNPSSSRRIGAAEGSSTIGPQSGDAAFSFPSDICPPNRRLRALVLLTDGFGGFGGIAKFNRDFLSALCSHPDVAEVIALPRLAPESTGPLPDKLTYREDGLGGKLRYFRAVTKAACLFRWTAHRERSAPPTPGCTGSIIVCGHINLLPLAFVARSITGAPVALILHGIDAWTRHRNPIVCSLLPRVNAFVAVSRLTRERFLSWSRPGARPFFILPNSVDLSAFSPGPKNPELVRRHGLKDRTVIMTLARLPGAERYKGVDEVIEVLPEIAVHVPNLTYLICGDGDDRPRLEAKAAALGVRDRVVFAGRIPEVEKADYLRLADVFVMPGRGEGFGIVYLEALACGVPVIGSKLDGSRDALRDGKLGTLVDPRNADEIISAVLDLLQHPGRTPVPRNGEDGVDYFSFARFEQRVHAIMDAVAQMLPHRASSVFVPPPSGMLPVGASGRGAPSRTGHP